METTKEERAWTSWLSAVLIGRHPKRTLGRIAVLVVTCVAVFNLLLPIRVEGISMLPTYRDQGVNFVNRMAYLFHRPRRGDVVAIEFAGRQVMLMKRVIGLPGETISFHLGRAYINGQPLAEPYVKNGCNWEIEPRVIGPDEYYVVGDNRSMSESDHTKGIAVRRRIVGKVLL